MSSYTMTTKVPVPYEAAVRQVRAALAEAGFGVLTEIDLQATLKAKLGVDLPPQVILGACRPPLAHGALQADPSVATLLPCNVVVAAEGASTRVEVLDPAVMTELSPALAQVAHEARRLLTAMMESLSRETEDPNAVDA